MAADYTTSAIKIVPSAAAGTSVTPNATSFANSSWVEMITSTANAITLVGVTINPGTNTLFEVDIGTGAAGSEVVVGTLTGRFTTSLLGDPCFIPFPIAIDNVATATRVAVRMRKNGTSTVVWTFALSYYNNPVGGSVTTTTQSSRILPSASGSANVTPSGTAWTNSAWVQIIASTSSAIVLAAVQVIAAAAVEFEVDIGTGGAGSEVVVTRLRANAGTTSGGPHVLVLENPLDNIATATRIATRLRINSTSVTAWGVNIIYYNKPI